MASVYDPSTGRWWTRDGRVPPDAVPSAVTATIVPLTGAKGDLWLVIPRQETSPEQPFEKLSARQRQVVELAALGHSAKKIALQLDVGYETVRSHLKNAYQVLGVASRTELARMARGGLDFSQDPPGPPRDP